MSDSSPADRSAPAWEPRSSPPSLTRGELHIWYAELDRASATLEIRKAALSPDEESRANRIREPLARARFTAARGVLRNVLGGYLGLPPAELRLRVLPGGKPEICVPSGSDLRFNLSHSGGRALIAVAREVAVGVDIECVRPLVELDRLAGRVLAPAEALALEGRSERLRARRFLECWTRKEAYIKARGLGVFRIPLSDLDLGCHDALWRTVPLPGDDVDSWSVRSLDPPDPECVAAVVAAGAPPSVARFIWRTDT